eukprot:3309316-Pleurochrysis_carterae.AAC.1
MQKCAPAHLRKSAHVPTVERVPIRACILLVNSKLGVYRRGGSDVVSRVSRPSVERIAYLVPCATTDRVISKAPPDAPVALCLAKAAAGGAWSRDSCAAVTRGCVSSASEVDFLGTRLLLCLVLDWPALPAA